MDELVLTEQGVFLTTNPRGEIPLAEPGTLGLYYQDTRFLSGLEVRIDGAEAPLLGVDDRGYVATLSYGAVAESPLGTGGFPADVLLRRIRYISVGADRAEGDAPAATLHERISLTSYQREPRDVTLSLAVAADFLDLFNLRGFATSEHGTYGPVTTEGGAITLSYTGRDGLRRYTVCHIDPVPDTLAPTAPPSGVGAVAHLRLHLLPAQEAAIDVVIHPLVGTPATLAPVAGGADAGFSAGLAQAVSVHDAWLAEECTRIETDDAALNAVLGQSLRDLRLLLLAPPTGPYVAAGIPWFAVPFGRDGLITSIETLMVNPRLAMGTLRYLALHQGRQVDPRRDEEPGKIMHEMRAGETVRAGLMPFDPYYGTVDGTALFLVLLGRVMQWTDDTALLHELAPAVRASLDWLDRYGDLDGDGYIEFQRKAGQGLANQGWKDSGDSLQFPDGTFPQAPIALVEAQGYAYDARLAGAMALRAIGDESAAQREEQKARDLRERFNQDFWMPVERFFAQALDAAKQAIPAVTSNVGHALWSGVVADDHAAAVAERLLSADMASGWGIRTLSTAYPSYNPLSYHNGSVWPHDTAIVAAGLKRYGHHRGAATLLTQVVAAATGYADARLPELYAGLPRDAKERGPVPYPVSCSPQAWSAASVFLMLQSALGLEADAPAAAIRVCPLFPPGLHRVSLSRLRVGVAMVDLEVEVIADGNYRVTATAGAHASSQLLAPGTPGTIALR